MMTIKLTDFSMWICIALSVFVHALWIFLGHYWAEATPIKSKPERLLVQSVSLKREKPQAIEPIAMADLPKPVEKPQVIEPIATASLPKPVRTPVEKPVIKKPEPVKKAQDMAKQAQVKQALKSLAMVGKSESKKAQATSLAVDKLEHADYSWGAKISAKLKNELILPEKGDVLVELHLNSSGEVHKLVIIKSASDRNKKTIEEKVPRIKFPPSDNKKGGTFAITLSHENS